MEIPRKLYESGAIISSGLAITAGVNGYRAYMKGVGEEIVNEVSIKSNQDPHLASIMRDENKPTIDRDYGVAFFCLGSFAGMVALGSWSAYRAKLAGKKRS